MSHIKQIYLLWFVWCDIPPISEYWGSIECHFLRSTAKKHPRSAASSWYFDLTMNQLWDLLCLSHERGDLIDRRGLPGNLSAQKHELLFWIVLAVLLLVIRIILVLEIKVCTAVQLTFPGLSLDAVRVPALLLEVIFLHKKPSFHL